MATRKRIGAIIASAALLAGLGLTACSSSAPTHVAGPASASKLVTDISRHGATGVIVEDSSDVLFTVEADGVTTDDYECINVLDHQMGGPAIAVDGWTCSGTLDPSDDGVGPVDVAADAALLGGTVLSGG